MYDYNVLSFVSLHMSRSALQKLLGILMALGMAVVYVLSGAYGNLNQLGVVNAILIIFQLSFAAIVVIYLEELQQKGYGLGSGISLFIVTNIWYAT